MRMGRVLGAAALVGAGVLAYRAMQKRKHDQELQGDEMSQGLGMQPVRDAGPANMSNDQGRWSRADERSDESFPASDPPATY